MSSRREQLVVAAVAALNAAGKPAGVTVHRARTRPLAQDQLPAMVVYLLSEDTTRGDGRDGYKARRNAKVRIECRVAVEDDTPPDTAVDPLLTWATKAMMADPYWGGLARNTQEDATTWDADETDRVYAAAAVDFTIDYLTAAGDPDTL
jgi:hypothetical protein